MRATKVEKDWIAKLQAVLDECPTRRIGFYTVGDASLSVYDRTKEKLIGDCQDSGADFCHAVQKAKAEISNVDSIDFPALVHSTSG